MKLKKLVALVLAGVMTIGLSACGGTSSTATSTAASKTTSNVTSKAASTAASTVAKSTAASASTGTASKSDGSGLKISYIVKAKTDEFWTTMEKSAESYAKEKGIELDFQAPEKETDVEKQVQMVENAVVKGVDAIILSAADSKSLVPAIVKANQANIPVILVNDTIDEDALKEDDGKVATYVGIDQYNAAKLAGDYAAKTITDGKICYLEGISGVQAHDDRLKVFTDQVTSFTTVASQTAKCDRNEAFNVMQNVLSKNSDVNVVWAINAEMGQGAVQAITQGGYTGKISVFDFDASSDDLQAIEDGTLTGTVAQYPNIQASTAIDCAIKAVNGETLDAHTETEAELITKDNLAAYKEKMADYLS